MKRRTIATRLALSGLVTLAVACGPDSNDRNSGAPAARQSTSGLADVLALHNRYRAQHCVAPLAWSPDLARRAQAWAARCDFSHSDNGFGENIAWGTAGAFSPSEFVSKWYKETADYDFAAGRGRGSRVTGHFTQIVWADSQQIGCGWARCGGSDFLVCNYSPPGNYSGRYQSNVRPRC